MPAFVLPTTDIDESGRSFHFTIEPAWLREALTDTGLHVADDAVAGTLEVFAQKTSGEDYVVRSRVKTLVNAPCARCLEDVALPVDLELTTLVHPKSAAPRNTTDEEDLDIDEDSPDVEYYSGELIILDPVIRENVVLEEPMQTLCREDCPGIEIPAHLRPPADFEPAVDPRLAPLLKLRRDTAQNEE
jgi:uncharacterized protein